jgi:hypothetical protein
MLSLALGGCGTFMRVAYNHSDTAVSIYANDYFDLNDRQAELLRARFAHFQSWHRREELPRYAQLFSTASERIRQGLQPADVQWAMDEVRQRYRVLATEGVADALPVLTTISDENIVALQKKFEDKNEDFRDKFLHGSTEKRDKARIKQLSKRFEDWLGDLNPTQQKLIGDFVRAHAHSTERRFAERQRRQRELVALLRQYRSASELGAQLGAYFRDWERNRPAQVAQASQQWDSDFVALVIALDHSLSAAQREHVAQAFKRYAEDFRALAAERPAAVANDDTPRAQIDVFASIR